MLHSHKDKPSARTDIQKQFFSHRAVGSWNLLSSRYCRLLLEKIDASRAIRQRRLVDQVTK